MSKGDKPWTARDLSAKLSALWKLHGQWKIVSLGRGYYEFQFASFEDMRIAWSMGSMNLKPGVLRLSKWTNDFNPYTQRQTHAQIWIRLMELPQEYWRQRTLFEIASAVGTPLALDESTNHRTFGHYARVLVDIDLSRRIFDEITVERDGYQFKLGVVYERLPEFCNHCNIIGHNFATCKWLHPTKPVDAREKRKPAKDVVVSKSQTQYVAKAKPTLPGPSAEAKPVEEVETTKVVDLVKQQQQSEAIHDGNKDAAINENTTQKNTTEGDTAFNIALDNVFDDIAHVELPADTSVLYLVENEAAGQNIDVDENKESADIVPETQPNIEVVSDTEFDEEVQRDLQFIKNNIVEDENFTLYVSKHQKKINKRLASSAGQPYNTRSRGVKSNSSL
jgi:hypothetical protein